MKNIKYLGFTLAVALTFSSCEQEVMERTPVEVIPIDDCPDGASSGSADFSKYVAIGNSVTAGFQAGALFNEGQNTSVGKILAEQFECVGGGEFNQPSINTEKGFFTGAANPVGNVVLGRLLLQGTPPAPAPTISDAAAIPNPSINPGFLYTGDKTKLNNFAVPGITLVHLVKAETGDWTNSAHPLFNPFYARFAKTPGTSTILGDAMTALADGGTFFSFWLGSNDVLGYAIGGASNPAILTPLEPNADTGHPGFAALFQLEIANLLSIPEVKGVVGNIPDVTKLPYFRLVTYNAVPLDAATATTLNGGFAGYNQILDAFKGQPFNFPPAAMDARKITFAAGQNSIVISDETLTDLGPYFDALLDAGQITDAQRAGLEPYRKAREATSTDLITLSAGAILGKTVGNNPLAINGVTIPLADQYVLIPSETTEITERTTAFNNIINQVVSASDRLALADVYAKYNQLLTAGLDIQNGVAVTSSLAPPTGIFSEDGLHPNSRGAAYTANVFIDAINQKFGASVPKANLSYFKGTALPVNP